MSNNQLVTLGQLSRQLGVNSRWLRQAAQAGQLPHGKTGDGFLFDCELVKQILLERARAMPTAPTVEPRSR
jgi:hypothetical protein